MLGAFPDLLEVDWAAFEWLTFLGRLHPLLLHVPIGLLLLLFLVELHGVLRRRQGERDGTRNYLVGLLLLVTPLVAFSGWTLAEEGYGDGISLHRWFGVATAGLVVAMCVAYVVRGRAYRTLLVLSFAGVVATGHLGAEITHGDDFLFEPFEDAIPGRGDGPANEPEPETGDDPADGGTATGGAGLVADGSDASGLDATGVDATGTAGDAAATGAEDSATTGGSSTVGELLPEDLTSAAAAPTWADVEPILGTYCTKCHGERKQKADLALHTRERVLARDEFGALVEPGDPASSYLIEVLFLPKDRDEAMPPEDKPQPSADEIALLEAWIAGLPADGGASADPDGAPDADATSAAATGTSATGDTGGGAGSTDGGATGLQAGGGAGILAGGGTGSASSAVGPDTSAPAVDTAAPAPAPDPAAVAAYLTHLRRQLVDAGVLPDGGGLRLDLPATPLEPGALGALLGTPPAPLHELVLFGHELAAADLTWLRARAAAAPGLAVLDLRGLGGAPLDLGPLAATADGAPHHLRDLNLAGTTLAPGAVDHLAALPGLERVVLWGTGLGDADLARLAEVRPDLALVGASPPSDAPLETEPEVVFVRAAPAEAAPDADATAGPGDAPAALVAENATCPVSGSPVDPRYTVAYAGRLIGFCCPNCPKSFWDDPDTFLAELDAE